MQNKEMEDNIKMHRSDTSITGFRTWDSARDSYDFHDLAPGYLKGKIRQYWSKL